LQDDDQRRNRRIRREYWLCVLSVFCVRIVTGNLKCRSRWLAAGLAGFVLALLSGAAFAQTVQPGRSPDSSNPSRSRAVTFNRDVAPILREKCGGCHRPDGGAPFS
jgi:hypothetical protein